MRLSRELHELKPTYDAVVVGSGYGAGVAASRLARMGLSVAVLERGLEIPIGEFPDTAPEALEQFQYTVEGRHIGRRTGLYDMHLGRDMHVLVGCGLGGTSLINANVSLPPNARIWEDRRWPSELFDDDSLNQGYERASAMLRPLPYPEKPGKPMPEKLARLAEAAERLETPLTRPPINVVFEAGPNAAGVYQPACTDCGDCCSGCNVGAKSTTQMTYLPDAVDHGADIFTDVSVRHLRKEGDGWRIFYVVTSQRRDGFHAPERSISAHMVVLGAGSLGSTEILLRSRQHGLAVSQRLGHGFTGNGDVLAFAWNGQKSVNAVGTGNPPRSDVAAPGPCITGAIDLRHAGPFEEGMIIEEGVLPSGLAEVAPALFNVAGRAVGKETTNGVLDEFQQAVRRAESWVLGAYKGAMHHTATYLVMAHDDAAGRLHLDDDRIAVEWPGVASQAVFERVGAKLLETSAANSAVYIRNPIQETIFGKNLITVHPLGGCGMGHDSATGVVDHKCRVFDASPGAAPKAVHAGLYVVDGAALPRSVGVNPLLTISAVAERAMIHVARDLGRHLTTTTRPDKPVRHLVTEGRQLGLVGSMARALKRGVHMSDLDGGKIVTAMKSAADRHLGALTSQVATAGEMAKRAADAALSANPDSTVPTPQDTGDGPRPAGVTFTERMAGHVSDRTNADYEAAATVGRANASEFAFTVSVDVSDIDAFLLDPRHEGTLTGTAICKDLSPEPLDISNGIFRLMRRSDDQVETRHFEYLMTLTARDGRSFAFTGRKNVHDDRRFGDLWRDTTTLYVDVQEQGGAGLVRRGLLTIAPEDFARQLATLKGTGGRSPLERLNATAKFGVLFAGTLYDVYGGIFAPAKRFNPTRVRKKRPLRAGTPRVHPFTTADGKHLRLTRYNLAGRDAKGPLLFTHGLGVASSIFSIDTIDTNLLEYMAERGWDCWLLDFRASIDLPYARERWTADDCARFDYQPAIDLIRRETGAETVQVMAHCFGSTTFVMSLLGGYVTGVRSAVLSQIAADVIVKFFPQRLLAYLRAPALFDLLKIDYVNARATTEDGFANKLMDALIRVVVPFQREERSRNATSNRITALYGQLYESDQLNALTFDSGLAEMFGEANIDAFKQLALLTRKQVLLDARGEDVYMPHLNRMAFPICFIHGAENACFQPESTARTLDKLSARNGGKLYTRHVIPNYGHIDCIFGKNAATDVYPKIHEHFEKSAKG